MWEGYVYGCVHVNVGAPGGQRQWILWSQSCRQLWATWHECWERNLGLVQGLYLLLTPEVLCLWKVALCVYITICWWKVVPSQPGHSGCALKNCFIPSSFTCAIAYQYLPSVKILESQQQRLFQDSVWLCRPSRPGTCRIWLPCLPVLPCPANQ